MRVGLFAALILLEIIHAIADQFALIVGITFSTRISFTFIEYKDRDVPEDFDFVRYQQAFFQPGERKMPIVGNDLEAIIQSYE